ncbi:hypothetical protein P167DRAFT_301584 [Morchella conica CCBAS932]|uniref:Uncharacterized protein n=1 Tax=Morchella conica CCBAS932 TaxID=1392247 RepID=A0A3N4KJH9_9PEZI|nr:hypothetical protein P167DRAFT_301584 [Morchella conica CCBAS932]
MLSYDRLVLAASEVGDWDSSALGASWLGVGWDGALKGWDILGGKWGMNWIGWWVETGRCTRPDDCGGVYYKLIIK